jgi:hypothetical protein
LGLSGVLNCEFLGDLVELWRYGYNLPAHDPLHWLHRTLGDVMKALFLESVVMAAAVTVSVGLAFFTLEVVLVVLDAAL